MSQDPPIDKLIERLDRIARQLETRFPPLATSIPTRRSLSGQLAANGAPDRSSDTPEAPQAPE